MALTRNTQRAVVDTATVWVAALVAALLAQTAVMWLLVALSVQVMGSATGWVRRPWSVVWSVLLVLAAVNSAKWPESDLAEYYAYLDYVKAQSWWALVTDPDSHLSIRVTEPLFRTFMWLLAQASPAPRITFTWGCSLLIYGAATLLCALFIRTWLPDDACDDPVPVVATAAALLAGLTFSLTAHLVRQYLAGALFTLAVVLWVRDRRARVLGLALAATLVHNSAALLWLPLVWSWLHARGPRWALTLLVTVVVAANAGVIGILNDFAEAASLVKDDGRIGLALPALDLTLLILGWRVLSRGPRGDQLRPLWAYCIGLAALLLCIRDVPLLFFRMYFYVEFLRAALMAVLLCLALRHAGRWRPLLATVLLCASAGLCIVRLQGAEWSYQSHPTQVPDWLRMDRLVDRWSAIEQLRL